MMNRIPAGPGLFLAALLFLAPSVLAAREESSFAYEDYAAVLRDRVDARGRVDYDALGKEPARLDAFVSSLATLDAAEYARWKPAERIAFWLNAYNALTLEAIVRYRPGKSIREIEGVWKKLTWNVMGRERTLDEIENQILRQRFDEPRIHMGLVCASIGCPFLRREPFTGSRLGEQLDEQARLFFADRTKFRIDRERNEVHVSPLFDWFGKDFVKRYGTEEGPAAASPEWRAVLNFARRYVVEADRDYLRGGRFEIVLLDYDWDLNRRPTPARDSQGACCPAGG